MNTRPNTRPVSKRARAVAATLRWRDKNRGHIASYNRRRKEERQARVRGLKEQAPCADCGVSYPAHVMDFDHRPNVVKVANVSRMTNSGKHALARIRQEIEKCDLVCANCHRDRTYRRRKAAA